MRYVLIREQFASYLAQEMHSSQVSYGGGTSSSDDEDEEVGGWLSQSTFGLGAAAPQSTLSPVPPVATARQPLAMGPLSGVERRPLSSVDARFDVSLLCSQFPEVDSFIGFI